jgi:hypothetical protein
VLETADDFEQDMIAGTRMLYVVPAALARDFIVQELSNSVRVASRELSI